MNSLMEFIFGLLETLATWGELQYYKIRGKVAEVQQRLDRIRPQAANFWRNTVLIAVIAMVIPFIFFVAGIIFKQRWLIGIAGLVATIGHGLIFLVFAGLGDVIAMIIRWAKPSTTQDSADIKSARFIRFVGTILLGEMIVVGYAILVPVWNNPGAIFVVAMIAIILATMLVVWEMQFKIFRQIAFWIAVVSFVFFTIGFFLPNTFSILEQNAPRVDQYFHDTADYYSDTTYEYKKQRIEMLKDWRVSEEKAIIEMLKQNLIYPEDADRRMEILTNQYNKELKGIRSIGSRSAGEADSNDPDSTLLGDKLKKSIPNFPVALKIAFIAAAAFLILGLIWKKLSKNGWLKTAALLAIGGTAVYFIIAILQSSGIAI